VRHPWANLALLAVLLSQLVTGLVGLLGTSDPFRIVFWLHAIGAYALLVLLFAKALIVLDVLRRRPGWTADRVTLALLGALLLAVLVSGFVWIAAGPHYLLGYSVINLHAFAAIALVVVLSWHVLERRWIARVPRARDRRAFLRWAGVALAGVALISVAGHVASFMCFRNRSRPRDRRDRTVPTGMSSAVAISS